MSALRFFFTHTVDRPDLARRLVRLAHPRKLPVVLSRDEVDGEPAAKRSDEKLSPRYVRHLLPLPFLLLLTFYRKSRVFTLISSMWP
ncbi:hypothetical protein [Borborobacter arsenicus]|uniref:hypothetical protein n=1 Tax=Borborobacter arsenicus TaxID=1851146 RepID=UPI003CCA77F9